MQRALECMNRRRGRATNQNVQQCSMGIERNNWRDPNCAGFIAPARKDADATRSSDLRQVSAISLFRRAVAEPPSGHPSQTSNAYHRTWPREAVPRCTYSTRSTTCATVTCTVQMDVRTDATGSSSGLCPSSSHEVEQFACFLRKLVGRRELMPRCLDPSRHSLRGVRREDPENMHFCILGT